MRGVVLSVAPPLAAVVRHAALGLEGLRLDEHAAALDSELARAEEELRHGSPAAAAAATAGAGHPSSWAPAVRAMYRQVGLDPTRRRPSSEALLRRVRKGERLPRINTLVDVCNWCSAEFQLPYGAYDADRLQGEPVLRLGQEGEHYAGIGKDDVHVTSRLVLADALGAFGNPSSDSARTMVTPETTRAFVVVYAPAGIASSALDMVLSVTSERVRRHAGGRETGRIVV